MKRISPVQFAVLDAVQAGSSTPEDIERVTGLDHSAVINAAWNLMQQDLLRNTSKLKKGAPRYELINPAADQWLQYQRRRLNEKKGVAPQPITSQWEVIGRKYGCATPEDLDDLLADMVDAAEIFLSAFPHKAPAA